MNENECEMARDETLSHGSCDYHSAVGLARRRDPRRHAGSAYGLRTGAHHESLNMRCCVHPWRECTLKVCVNSGEGQGQGWIGLGGRARVRGIGLGARLDSEGLGWGQG